MELKDFLRGVHREVGEQMILRAATVDASAPFAELVFTEIFAGHMAERALTFEPQSCRFSASVDEGVLRLSGYALSEDVDCLDLFVSVYCGDEEPRWISEEDAFEAVEQCGRFLELSARGVLAARVDETHDAFPLISTIGTAWPGMTQVRIRVLTDMCAGTVQLPALDILGRRVPVEVVDIERIFDERPDVELQNRFRMLSKFRDEWVVSVQVTASREQELVHAVFVDDAGTRLTDAEEFADFQRCQFEEAGSRHEAMQVDGYALDDADGSLVLMIVDFSGAAELQTIGIEEVHAHFDSLGRFAEAALAGDLSRDGNPTSDPGIGLAADIVRLRSSISKLRLYLVSDRLSESSGEPVGTSMLAGIPVERHVWDAARFHKASVSDSGRDDLEVDFRGSDGEGIPALHAGSADGDYEGYLCTISGEVLATIYERHGSRLLEGNVRSFLSTKGKINTGIQTTIAENPAMFFAYNNGIAATAEAVELDAGTSRIAKAINLQIVNGGQTTASLAAAFRVGHDLSKVCVQMKLSVLSPTRAGVLIPLIARFANSQNKVNESDFFANHPYHMRLELLSKQIRTLGTDGAEGSRWFYERSRGQYVNEQKNLDADGKRRFLALNPKTQLLTKLDVAKLENTWKGLPHKVSNGAQKNFVFFAGWLAKRWNENDSGFDEQYFRNLIAMAILFRHTELLMTEQAWFQGAYRANIVTYSLAVLQFTVLKSGKGRQLDLGRIWKHQSVPEALSAQIVATARMVFGVLTDSDRPRANVTEWAKQEACWERARDAAAPLSDKMFDELVDPIAQRYADGNAVQQVGYGIFARTAVLGIRPGQWEELRQWAAGRELLDSREMDLLRTAIRIPRFVPSVKDCERIWAIRSKLIKHGFGGRDEAGERG